MELSLLHFLENIRSDIATFFACIFSLCGETLFLVLAVCLIYWLVDKKLGEKFILVSFSSMSVNGFLKNAVCRPRPYVNGITRVEIDTPFLSTMSLDTNASFPSGHSQMGAGLFFTSALHVKKRWAWIVFPLITLGVMLSRLYLGVHYPSDVLVGATLGISFAFFGEWILAKHEAKKYAVFAGFALLSILFCLLFPSKNMVELCACSLSSAICMPIENKFIRFENPTNGKNKFFRTLLGIALVGLVFVLFSYLPLPFLQLWRWKFIKYALTIATASLLVPYLFKKLKI